MDNNYIKLSTGDIIQTDDIIHISNTFYPANRGRVMAFSILYAGKERVIIEYENNKIGLDDMEMDKKIICKKIGINC